MRQHSRILRTSARAAVGIVATGACIAALALLWRVDLPSVERVPSPIAVDTQSEAQRTLVCSGSFAELGADQERPGVAIPRGAVAPTVSAEGADTSQLSRSEGGEGLPAVLTASSGSLLAAAQLQTLRTETLDGTVGSACVEPQNDQWVIGGATTVGISTTLSLGNPGSVPAIVQITVHDESGTVDAATTSGVLVQPGTEQILSMNGYAPDRARLAVHISSTGAPVSASLGVSEVAGISPFAVSSVTHQREPETTVVIPGVASEFDHNHGSSEGDDHGDAPVTVRVLAPEAAEGTATVSAIDEHGKRTSLGEVELVGNAVAELSSDNWPHDANAVIVEADVPIVASALGTVIEPESHDYEWFAHAPEIPAETTTAIPVVKDGNLVLVNLGDRAAKVSIESLDGSGSTREVSVKPGAATVVRSPVTAKLTSSQPLHAGVRYLRGGDIAGYPVVAPDPGAGELLVYTR